MPAKAPANRIAVRMYFNPDTLLHAHLAKLVTDKHRREVVYALATSALVRLMAIEPTSATPNLLSGAGQGSLPPAPASEPPPAQVAGHLDLSQPFDFG